VREFKYKGMVPPCGIGNLPREGGIKDYKQSIGGNKILFLKE